MTPVFFDTHCHLDYPDFDPDRVAVMDRARAAGVGRIIAIGTDLKSSRAVLRLAELHDEVYAVVGWHPGQVTEAPADIRPELRAMAAHPKVVGIGETGLDHHRLPEGEAPSQLEHRDRIRRRQVELFQQQLEVAAELGLNCVIHQRDAFVETLEILEPFAAKVRGVFHCFTNPVPDLERVLALGSLVSFTGVVTFKNAAAVRESAAAAPAGRFMLETDAPFLAPVPHRGRRCEPAHVRNTAEAVAAARRCSIEDLSRMTCGAAEGFFRGLGG